MNTEDVKQLIRTYASAINNKLKIVYYQGKRLLNTENANYSYGTLVDVLEYGLDTIPMENINSVLLLGMGGGSIKKSLKKKYGYAGPVVAVEIDPVVVEIAQREFDVVEHDLLEIHCADAWNFIEQCHREFDLIIVDIFIDTIVPEKFYDPEFWAMIEKNVTQNGFILFNAGIDLDEAYVQEFVCNLPESFIYQKNYRVLESNTVIIMQKVF